MLTPVNGTPSITDIRLFKVGEDCLMSAPCKHDCLLLLTNGTTRNVQLSAPGILYLHDNLCESKVLNPWGKVHFSEQMQYLTEYAKDNHMERLKNHVRI